MVSDVSCFSTLKSNSEYNWNNIFTGVFTVCANKISLTSPHFIERPVPRQDNGYVYTTFYWKVCTKAGQWLCIHHILLKGLYQGRTMVMYTCVWGINFVHLNHFVNEFWNCSDNLVLFFHFIINFCFFSCLFKESKSNIINGSLRLKPFFLEKN